MARATSRLTRAWEIAISRRPSSQIGSDTVSASADTFRAVGKKLSSNLQVRAGQGEPRQVLAALALEDGRRPRARWPGPPRYCGP